MMFDSKRQNPGKFKLTSDFKPKGDQPKAIETLTNGILKNIKHQVLLGVTGSGKTFTIANVIANVNKPALVIAHNKTLAAQLYGEFRTFFPENAVEYFVSYYDYYQPEAYIPSTDTYIEKDALINDDIDRMRHAATCEQIVRPTGLIDPAIELRSIKGQVDDLLKEIKEKAVKKERILVTTLTKRMAEDITDYYQELGIKARYLHSDIDTLERIEILRDLRLGKFDALIGVNLLREGLDLPEVSLVAVLDADKEGFLRSARSLIQTAGRAARNINGRVILYADTVTGSMKTAIDETNRRRKIQEAYNRKHKINLCSKSLFLSQLGGARHLVKELCNFILFI